VTADEMQSGRALDSVVAAILRSYLYQAVAIVALWMFLSTPVAIALTILVVFIHRAVCDQTVYIHNRILDQHTMALRNAMALAIFSKLGPQVDSQEGVGLAMAQAFTDADRILLPVEYKRPLFLEGAIASLGVEAALLAGCAYSGLKLSKYGGNVVTWVQAFAV